MPMTAIVVTLDVGEGVDVIGVVTATTFIKVGYILLQK